MRSIFSTKYLLIPFFLFFLIGVAVTFFFLGRSLNTLSKQEKPEGYEIYYVKDQTIYGANLDALEATAIVKGHGLQRVSPRGSYMVTGDDASQKTQLLYGNGQELTDSDLPSLVAWSQDEHYGLSLEIQKIERQWEQTYTLWDLETQKQVKRFGIPAKMSLIGIRNNGDVIVRKILPNRTAESDNVEIYRYDPKTGSLGSIRTLRFSSMPEKLSPDTNYLAFSDGLNVQVYDFSTNTLTQYTFTKEINRETAWNVYWSPNGHYLAFQTFGNFDTGDRIGIIDMKTKNIHYIDERIADRLVPHTSLEAGLDVVDFVPVGWSRDSTSLIVKLEGTLSYRDGRVQDIDSYWIYNLTTQKYTKLSFLAGIQYPIVTF